MNFVSDSGQHSSLLDALNSALNSSFRETLSERDIEAVRKGDLKLYRVTTTETAYVVSRNMGLVKENFEDRMKVWGGIAGWVDAVDVKEVKGGTPLGFDESFLKKHPLLIDVGINLDGTCAPLKEFVKHLPDPEKEAKRKEIEDKLLNLSKQYEELRGQLKTL